MYCLKRRVFITIGSPPVMSTSLTRGRSRR